MFVRFSSLVLQKSTKIRKLALGTKKCYHTGPSYDSKHLQTIILYRYFFNRGLASRLFPSLNSKLLQRRRPSSFVSSLNTSVLCNNLPSTSSKRKVQLPCNTSLFLFSLYFRGFYPGSVSGQVVGQCWNRGPQLLCHLPGRVGRAQGNRTPFSREHSQS